MIPESGDNGYLPPGIHPATLDEIVDCVLLIGGPGSGNTAVEAELLDGLPFLTIELVDGEAFQHLTENTFHTDRNSIPKGMVEVMR